jgi:hypothetical protein
MTEIKIEVMNTQLEELGLDQSPTYIPFRFKDSAFVGYWTDSLSQNITFYVGDGSFVCRNNKKNIDIFESLLK